MSDTAKMMAAPSHETPRNDLAGRCVATKADQVRCLNLAIDASPIPRKVLAEDHCHVGESYFSKVVNGREGDFLALVDTLPADIRTDYRRRVTALEDLDLFGQAVERLALECVRVLRLRREHSLPRRAARMATAADRKRESAR